MSTPTPPASLHHENIHLTFPTSQIILITISRIQQMNSITSDMHQILHQIWTWYDTVPSLRCAIVTGAIPTTPKPAPAFSAGADLKEWLNHATSATPTSLATAASGGFMGLSTRRGKKPVIAAVHGICFGGGFEAAVNCDLVIAHASSRFGLPEAQRGVVAIAGVLPRLALAVGLQRAGEMALAGRVLSAHEAREWGVVTSVVEEGKGGVVEEAVRWAQKVAGSSPDSIIVTREGLRSVLEEGGVEEKVRKVEQGVFKALQEGENIKEGLRAFKEKRKERWMDSKL